MENAGVFFIAVLLFGAALASTGGMPSTSDYYEQGTITCSQVDGEIVGKEPPITILVVVNDRIGGDTTNYKVYVSPEAYQNYSVGDTHVEEICTFSDYSTFKRIIDQLLESGVLE
tara:strand:+ start:2612 stop:2956 length:345 start_codon:yes stop_codon:yes gene_type:complete